QSRAEVTHMEATFRLVDLEQRTRASSERSAVIITKAEALIERSAALLRHAALVKARCRRLTSANGNDSSLKPRMKTWLLAIASVIRDWHTMPKDEIGATMAKATPAEAAAYIVELHVPRDLRESILRALPPLTQYSFHHAAWQIRHAALQHAA